MIQKIIYKYDFNNNIIELYRYMDEELLKYDFMANKILFEYDSKNNLIKESHYNVTKKFGEIQAILLSQEIYMYTHNY